MAKKVSTTAIIAEEMKKSTLESLASILKQEGLEKAMQRRRELNDTFSENEWWPPVAKAMREFFDNYIWEQEEKRRKTEEKKRQEAEALAAAPAAQGGNATIVIGGSLAGMQQKWIAGQIVGVNEGDVVMKKITGS